MLKKLTFKPPTRSFIACCIEFRERQEFCRTNIIPLLLKKSSISKKIVVSTSNSGIGKTPYSKKELKNLIREITHIIRTSPRKRRPSIKEWISEVKNLIKAREDAATERLNDLENKLLDAKVDYSNSIIMNESMLDQVVNKMNSLIQRLDGLNFREDSILDNTNSLDLKKIEILSQVSEYLRELLALSNKVEEVSNSIRNSKSLKSSKIYTLLLKLKDCLQSVRLIENEKKMRLNIKNSIYNEISRILDNILDILINQITSFLKEYCDWGQFDKIVQQVLSRKSSNFALIDPLDLSKLEKNEKISHSIGILLVLSSICIELGYECKEIQDSADLETSNGYRKPRINICEEIISRLGTDIAIKLKPLFFSRNSSLSSLEKPEWLLETYFSIFKSHYRYLKNLWNDLNTRFMKIKNEEKNDMETHLSKYIPLYIEKEKYISVISEILSVDPKKILSITLISNLQNALRIFLRRVLCKDGVAVRDNKADCIFEKLVEQLLLFYRQWKELDEETSIFILFDLLTNLNINKLLISKKSSIDGLFEEDNSILQMEDLSKTAVSWAKSAFTLVMGSPDPKYLEIFNNPSTFPSECGILDWYCILNRIYIAGQSLGYLTESLISSYIDKFNMKRTIHDLYLSICSHSGSSDQNIILKWLSDTVVYISDDSLSKNGQKLIMPIKSSSNENQKIGRLILVLGYSIETIELLNAFSGKISLLVDSCKSFEKCQYYTKKDQYRILNLILAKFHEIRIELDSYPPKIFCETFSTPIIEQSIVGEFINYIRGEWNRVGHKIGPMIPMVSILLESVDIVYFTVLNLDKDNNANSWLDSKPKRDESFQESLQNLEEKPMEKLEYISKMYEGPLLMLRELKEEMINEIKLELTEVIIKPLIYSEIVIPSLEDLLNSNSFSGNARLLFDDNLAKKVNELKYTFVLFNLFLSDSNLIEISKALSV
ncbi:uncharacterized protein cubi_03231 [Cryptosporidium ubiquitum]|uniref:Uncharacterized protein n=1 Tax=Cryptosporidium ubiquitum TaxID=857276 RepID=A0A1J4MDI5_9CRYT|nr:uncharacterized protein cubi_03231 [Cryptosporidium ubiquitum]OII70933.1 hypothetical protein cubi_03231 [Cryptosporidium ubiquitum]